jgi:tRNA threonylcarbamoyladenosine biosynthesis protein TsaB
MRLLALDTATEACSVALLTEEGILTESAEIGRGHAQQILPMVDRILAQGGTTLAGLSGIAAGIGPGSFTGVRVSVAVAQGLAFGADLPVVPVTSLEALAMQALGRGAESVLACLDARMGEVYWGWFVADAAEVLRPVSPAAVGPPTALRVPDALHLASVPGTQGWRGIGRGFTAYPELSTLPGLRIEAADARALPGALEMARLGAHRLRSGGGVDPQFLKPSYLRDKVAMTEAERGTGTGTGTGTGAGAGAATRANSGK